MTTKERIVDEALSLFSVKGFNGTSVKNIAEAVGIKDSSIYKHFGSKKEILDAIVEGLSKRIETMSKAIGLPQERSYEEEAKLYGELSLEGLKELSRKVFLFYLKDEYISRFWRLSMIEQYQHEEIYEVYWHLFMEESIAYQSKLFEEMIKQGIFRKADPQVLAMSFYSPIYFLLSKYSKFPDRAQEALQILDKQIEDFYHNYRK
ncbi:MAG: TetR/AcrR family transcriptional regulator [Lachnospiraceae bacterium]